MTGAGTAEGLAAMLVPRLAGLAQRSSRCVYSATFGSFAPPAAVDPELAEQFDFVLFTDQHDAAPAGWQVVLVELEPGQARLANRILKWSGPSLFRRYDWIVYVDGNIRLAGRLVGQLELVRNRCIGLPNHPFRRSVYQEACECYASNRIGLKEALELFRRYGSRFDFFAEGLTENNLVIYNGRRATPAALEALRDLREALLRGPQRDQLHLLPILARHAIEVARLPDSSRAGSWGEYQEHRKAASTAPGPSLWRRWGFEARRTARLCFCIPLFRSLLLSSSFRRRLAGQGGGLRVRAAFAGGLVLVNLALACLMARGSTDELRQFAVNLRAGLTTRYVSDTTLFALPIAELRGEGFLVDDQNGADIGASGQTGTDLEQAVAAARLLRFNKKRQVYHDLSVTEKSALLQSGEYVGFCSDYSESFILLAAARGVFAREVHNAKHTFNEIYDRQRGSWVFIDPMFGLTATGAGGKHLSAMELREHVLRGVPFRMVAVSANARFGNAPHLYGREAFSRFSMTLGNNVLEENRFKKRYSLLPKPLRSMAGMVGGVIPRHAEYLEDGWGQAIAGLNRFVLWSLLFAALLTAWQVALSLPEHARKLLIRGRINKKLL